MLNLEYIKPIDNLKLTVQKNGRIAFSAKTRDIFDLENNKYCAFAKSKDDDKLYFKLQEEKNCYTYQISKMGAFYYINAISFFNEVDIDYANNDINIIFELNKVDEQENMYEMVKRVIKKVNK